MSNWGELTPAQRRLLDRISSSDLAERFYLTGGSALSAFYLRHRESHDLDIFSRQPFDPKEVVRFLNSVAEGDVVPHRAYDRYEFTVPLAEERLRVEFVHYNFDLVAESGIAHGRVRVDSLRDILANKLSAIIERTEGKDYADLFFLLRRPDLGMARGMEDCARKFGWPGLQYLLQPALLRAVRLTAWPETHPVITLEEVKRFFGETARALIRLDEEKENT